jgi:hypothetical protein
MAVPLPTQQKATVQITPPMALKPSLVTPVSLPASVAQLLSSIPFPSSISEVPLSFTHPLLTGPPEDSLPSKRQRKPVRFNDYETSYGEDNQNADGKISKRKKVLSVKEEEEYFEPRSVPTTVVKTEKVRDSLFKLVFTCVPESGQKKEARFATKRR